MREQKFNRLHYDIEVMTRRLELEKRRLQRIEKDLAVAKRTHHNRVAHQALKPSQASARPSPRNLRRQGDSCMSARASSASGQRKPGLPDSMQVDDASPRSPRSAAAIGASDRHRSVDAREPPTSLLVRRLDVGQKRLDSLKHDTVKLHDEINVLRHARLQGNALFDRLRNEIKTRSAQLADFVEEMATSQAINGDVRHRIAVMKGQREGERSRFKKEVMRCRDQLKYHDWQKKEVEVGLKRAETGVQQKRGLIIPEEETFFSETLMMRRIMKTAFLNCIQRRHIKQHQKSIEVFEQAFAIIKQSTGIEQIEDIVKIFVSFESKNYSLLTYVNHMNSEIEALETAKRERQAQEFERQQALHQHQQVQQQAFQHVERQLYATQLAMKKETEAREQQASVLAAVQPDLLRIVERVEKEVSVSSIGKHLSRPISDLTNSTMPEWLEWLERALGKFRELMPTQNKDAVFPHTAAEQVKQLVPKRLGGHAPSNSLVKTQELPQGCALADEGAVIATRSTNYGGPVKVLKSDGCDDESEEDDLTDRPLKPQEIRSWAEHAVQRRRKRLTPAKQHTVASTPTSVSGMTLAERPLESRASVAATSESNATHRTRVGSSMDGATTLADFLPASPGQDANDATADLAIGFSSGRPQTPSLVASRTDAREDGVSADEDEEANGQVAVLATTSAKPAARVDSMSSQPPVGRSASLEPEKGNSVREVSEEELEMLFLSKYKMTAEELQVMVDGMGIQLCDLVSLKRAFELFDYEKSGWINIGEVKPLLVQLGEEHTDEAFEDLAMELDADRTGEVEFFEFADWFASTRRG